MWIVAGLLLGLTLVTALIGFHSGPHVHVVAAVLGVAAAAWLLFMASDGQSAPLLWVLFSADVAMSGGIGVIGWMALRRSDRLGAHVAGVRLEGSEGVAVTDLTPEGIVRVRGEEWSATCVNGRVAAGSPVQVLHGGVRIEVWAESPLPDPYGARPQDLPPEAAAPKKEQSQ